MSQELTLYKPNPVTASLPSSPAVVRGLDRTELAIIRAAAAPEIGTMPAEAVAGELRKKLPMLAMDVGCKIVPGAEWDYKVMRITEVLQTKYPRLALPEIRVAFDMLVAWELDDYLPRSSSGQPDRGHYQQFSLEYICKVLNAYNRKRGQVLSKALGLLPPEFPEAPGRPERAYPEKTYRDCVTAFLEYKYRGRMPALSFIMRGVFYDILSRAGLAAEFEVTAEIQRAIFQSAMNDFARAGEVAELERLRKKGETAGELQARAAIRARDRELERTFAWMVENEVQITDYVTIKDEN